jgi:hypothetical protein
MLQGEDRYSPGLRERERERETERERGAVCERK